MKVDKTILANAFALTIGITYILCRFLATFVPELFMQITRSWFHLIEIEQVRGREFLGTNYFILGLITSVGAAWLFGYVLGWSIEYFSKKK